MPANRDHRTRDRLLAEFFTSEETGGIRRFQALPLSILQELVRAGFADPAEQQNDAPTIGRILDFMKKHPGVRAHGYAVSPEREDYRVSLEGIEFEGEVSEGLRKDLEELVGERADERHVGPNGFWVWYD